MDVYEVPNKEELESLRKEGLYKLNRLREMVYNENLFNISLKNEMHYIESEKLRDTLSNISVRDFKVQFPHIIPSSLERNNIYNVYDLMGLVNNTSYKVPGVVSGYEVKLKKHLDMLRDSIESSIVLSFDLEKKDPNEEKILRILHSIDTKIRFYERVNTILDKWADKIEYGKSHMKTSIFWNISWYFKYHYNKVKTLEAKRDYLGFIGDFDLLELEEEYSKTHNQMEDIDVWEDFRINSAKYYALLENISGIKVEEDILYGDVNAQLVKEVNALKLNQDKLNVILRSWQEFGAKFTIKQKKVLIGDEMGLGKTIEALAVMADLNSKGKTHFLVVCPASIIINWCREVRDHSYLEPIKLHGSDRNRATEKWIRTGGVAISSYTTVQKLNFPKNLNIDLLVLDEAHYIKNEEAKRSQFAYKLTEKSEYTMYMTGTPIENNLEEMLNLIEKLNLEVIDDLNSNPINYAGDFFRETIGPVYLRRNRKDVLKELPNLTQIEEWVEFSPVERRDYLENIKEGNFMGMRRSGYAGQVKSKSPKISRILELVNQYHENGDKIIIFSFFKDVIRSLEEELKNLCVGVITGEVSAEKRAEILDEFDRTTSKSVLISQIQAGGVGLNIQQASTVIICEPQVKPSTESQAISRVYRMGQVKNVFVHRILTEDSIDEIMMQMLGTKQYVFDTYAKESIIGDKSLDLEPGRIGNIQEYIIDREREKYRDII